MQPPSPGARPAASSESGGDAPVIVAAFARVLRSASKADQAGLALRTVLEALSSLLSVCLAAADRPCARGDEDLWTLDLTTL